MLVVSFFRFAYFIPDYAIHFSPSPWLSLTWAYIRNHYAASEPVGPTVPFFEPVSPALIFLESFWSSFGDLSQELQAVQERPMNLEISSSNLNVLLTSLTWQLCSPESQRGHTSLATTAPLYNQDPRNTASLLFLDLLAGTYNCV